MSEATKVHRPYRPHAVVCDLFEHESARGEVFYTGRAGHILWAVSPVRNPVPGGPTHALILAETAHTHHADDPVIAAEALEREIGR